MNDLISRQAAIDAIFNEPLYESGMKKRNADAVVPAIYEKIKSLPSAQREIIRCKDCKHYYYADNRIPQEQRYVCDLNGDRWKPDGFCSYAERRTDGTD